MTVVARQRGQAEAAVPPNRLNWVLLSPCLENVLPLPTRIDAIDALDRA